MSKPDAELLQDALITAGDGDYIEIGTLWGGSAVLAALVKEMYSISGRVYAIDPMIGYYGADDGARRPAVSDFYDNLKRFSVDAELVQAYSDPFPINTIANVVLIDGDHSLEMVARDWMNTKEHSTRFIIFHDYNDPPIRDFVDSITDWHVYKKIDTMAVLERQV